MLSSETYLQIIIKKKLLKNPDRRMETKDERLNNTISGKIKKSIKNDGWINNIFVHKKVVILHIATIIMTIKTQNLAGKGNIIIEFKSRSFL